jgi:hypothetical protein
MKHRKGDDWFPFWIDKWFFGSTKHEFSPAERSVWVDLIAISKKDGGFIRANEGVPYPLKQLAGLFIVPKKLLIRTIQKAIQVGKLQEMPDKTLYVCSTEKYELSDRHKRRLETDAASDKTDIASKKADAKSREDEEKNSKEEKEKAKAKIRADALSFFEYFKQKLNKPLLRFDTWQQNIEARLKKYTLEILKSCADKMAVSVWHKENRQQGIELIISSDKRVEQWLEREKGRIEESQEDAFEKQLEAAHKETIARRKE